MLPLHHAAEKHGMPAGYGQYAITLTSGDERDHRVYHEKRVRGLSVEHRKTLLSTMGLYLGYPVT